MRSTEQDFGRALELYREWNERINVVSRKDIDSLYGHHILHSLCLQFLHAFQKLLMGIGTKAAHTDITDTRTQHI